MEAKTRMNWTWSCTMANAMGMIAMHFLLHRIRIEQPHVSYHTKTANSQDGSVLRMTLQSLSMMLWYTSKGGKIAYSPVPWGLNEHRVLWHTGNNRSGDQKMPCVQLSSWPGMWGSSFGGNPAKWKFESSEVYPQRLFMLSASFYTVPVGIQTNVRNLFRTARSSA